MAARETGLAAADTEEGIDTLRRDVRDAEGNLVQTIREIRARVSYEALKNRALAQVREAAVEKPRQMASSAARTAVEFTRKAQAAAKEYPIIPLVIGIAIFAPLVIGRLMRGRR